MKKSILCLLIALISVGFSNEVQCKTPANEKKLICEIKGNNVYLMKDPNFVRFIPQSVLIGSAVYESTLYVNNKQFVARFDCRIDRENISFDKTNYIFVKPQSCAGELHRLVCGY